MTKGSGLGDQLYIDGIDVGGDINSLSRIGGGFATWDTTDITQSAFSRLGLARDGGLEFMSYFNPTAGRAHSKFSALPTVDAIATYGRGTTLGNPGASLVAKQVNYDPNRAQDGGLLFGVQALANSYGIEWGIQLTAGKRTDGSATNGTGVDQGSISPGAFGLGMFVQLFAFTGTSVTIKIQESSDNGGGDAYTDVVGATTGALSAIGALRIQTGAINVEQWLRVVTTGTFSNAVFLVQAKRYETAVTF